MRSVEEHKRTPFDDLGGGGYVGMRDPARGPTWASREIEAGADPDQVLAKVNLDHDCPACDGIGQRFIWSADSRDLSPAAAALFNGVSVSKEGIVEVKIRDRDHALGMLAKHFGLIVNRQVTAQLDLTQLGFDGAVRNALMVLVVAIVFAVLLKLVDRVLPAALRR